MAWSSAGRAFASLERSTACAASRRLPGSGAISVKLPSVASTIRRRRLLRRTGARSAGGLPVTGSPVAASLRRSGGSPMKIRLLSALNRSRPSCRAVMIAAARALPLATTSLMPSMVWSKLSALKRDSASSYGPACAPGIGAPSTPRMSTPSTSTPSASTRAMKRSLKARILIVPAFVARRPNTSRLGRLDSCYQRNATVLLCIGRYDAPPHFLVTLL